jgi:hypothetical protein
LSNIPENIGEHTIDTCVITPRPPRQKKVAMPLTGPPTYYLNFENKHSVHPHNKYPPADLCKRFLAQSCIIKG